jgi:uncharacterized protein with FMN-binding domain
VPDGFLVDMGTYYPKGKGRIIYHSSDFLIELDVYDYADPKLAVKKFVSDAWSLDKIETDEAIARRFIDDLYSPKLGFVLVGTSKYYYKFRVQTGNMDDPRVLRFVDSIKIEGKSAFPQNIKFAITDEIPVSFSGLTTSTEIKTAENQKIKEREEYIKIASINEIKEQVSEQKKYSRLPFFIGVKLGYKDFVYQMIAKKDLGKVAARVLLKANGEIGEIEIFSKSDEKTTRTIVNQIRKMKFVPAQINGKNVDYIDVIEYDLDFSGRKILKG